MRLLSYNILDGGAERESLLARVIAASKPDIVALVEAEDAGVVERLGQKIGTDFIHAPGNTHASALLSRFPITRTVNHALLRAGLEKSLLEAAVIDPNLGEVTIGAVHLHARPYEADEDVRERELDVVLDVFAPHRDANRPHLLCGDFNANAPYQRIDPAKCKPRTQKEWAQNGGGLPRRAVQKVLDAGYVDTLREVDRAASETAGTFKTEFPGQRVDYVFAFGFERVRLQAWVEQSEPARGASDHFPVGVEVV